MAALERDVLGRPAVEFPAQRHVSGAHLAREGERDVTVRASPARLAPPWPPDRLVRYGARLGPCLTGQGQPPLVRRSTRSYRKANGRRTAA